MPTTPERFVSIGLVYRNWPDWAKPICKQTEMTVAVVYGSHAVSPVCRGSVVGRGLDLLQSETTLASEAAVRFHYLVAAHNEAAQLEGLCRRLIEGLAAYPGSKILLLENGSTDDTWSVCERLAAAWPVYVECLRENDAGMGRAFRAGLNALATRGLQREDWIVLAAADLPFGFSDVEGVRAALSVGSEAMVFVGSKAHPRSRVKRSWKRQSATWVFRVLRQAALGMRTQDPQGSIILRGDVLPQLNTFLSSDYFYSIELIYSAERLGEVTEIPIELSSELRPSRVRVVRDGWRMVSQLVDFRRRLKRSA